MRLFAFIMAVVVSVASVMPCMDRTDTFKQSAKTEISSSHNHSEHGSSDNCSPFCICSCCAGFTLAVFVQPIQHIKPTVSRAKTLYLAESISNISLPVWQPPQLLG